MNIAEQQFGRPSHGGRLRRIGVIGVLATVSAVVDLPPAQAGDGSAAVVSIADLDLLTADGRAAANQRLDRTARQVCSRSVDPWTVSHHEDYLRCVDDTIAAALAKLQQAVVLASAKRQTRKLSE